MQFQETTLKYWKLTVQGLPPRTNAVCYVSIPFVWSIAPATKTWSQVIAKCCLSHANPLSKREDLMLQNSTLLRKSAPWSPNIYDEHVSCIRLPREMHFCKVSANIPGLPTFLEMVHGLHALLMDLLARCRILCACHAKPHLNLNDLTWKCVSSRNDVHFFHV